MIVKITSENIKDDLTVVVVVVVVLMIVREREREIMLPLH
jgi:hypothetical protein